MVRIMTQNVCQLPLMPQPHVVHDVELTARESGVVLWQEMRPARYLAAMRNLNPKAWAHYYGGGGCPISWRKRIWEKLDQGHVLLHLKEPGVCENRYVTWVKLRNRKTGAVAIFHTFHYVPGAWTTRFSRTSRLRRAAMWNHGNEMHRHLVDGWVKDGYAVAGGGDTNSAQKRFPLLGKSIRGKRVRYPVDKNAIDQLVLIDGNDFKWKLDSFERRSGRFSDHQGRRMTVRLVPA